MSAELYGWFVIVDGCREGKRKVKMMKIFQYLPFTTTALKLSYSNSALLALIKRL